MFELNQLRSFIAVATDLNFRRAANRLNMTQPPLSRQIQLLEREVLLFDRSGRSIRLTAAGRRFFAEAQDLLRRADGAALSARRAQSGNEVVVLGFIPVAALGLLPEIIETLRENLPAVDIVLREMLTIDQTEALASRLIDLGVIRLPRDHNALHVARLKREPYLLAMHKNHPLARQKSYSLQDLHRQVIIEAWRRYYNTERPHSSLGYKPPAPEAVVWPAPTRGSALPSAQAMARKPIVH